MASPTATKRLTKEFVTLQKSPPPFVTARPLEENILEWHYVIDGPPDSPYAGGQFHGVLLFPREYPFKPPAIKMLTPNGRFKTNFRLCLSMSDYHPSTWNPAWSVASILTGLLSFMMEDTPTTGSIETSLGEKKRLAALSHAFNLENRQFVRLFADKIRTERLEESLQTIRASTSVPTQSPRPPPQEQASESMFSVVFLMVVFLLALVVALLRPSS